MAIKLDSLAADLKKENEGEWIEIGEWPGIGDVGDLAFKVRSTNTSAYTVAFNLALQKMERKYGKKPRPLDESEVEGGKLLADHIILDWRGLDVPYSAEVARAQLTDPAQRTLRAMVNWASAQVGKRDAEHVEAAAKNSVTPSAIE